MREWENYIRKVEPYTPGEQPKLSNVVKLNTNENPYPPSQGVLEAIKDLDYEKFRLYPDPAASKLVDAIGEYYKVGSKRVFPGVGSDDVLAIAFLTFFNSKKPILFPDVTYSFYDVWANLYRIPYKCPKLDENFRIKKEDYYEENGGIIIANPNAPTSIYEELSVIRDILDHNQDSIVIIDEAYIDFGGQSAIPLIEEYDNVLVVQTFSKSRSMAGMRIGYGIGSEKLIQAMNDVKYSFNSYTLNQTSIEFGVKSILDEEYFRECINKIIKTREYTVDALKELGFTSLNSGANFIFVTHKEKNAKDIFEYLRERQVFIRYFNKPRIDNYIRITIGTREQMEILIKLLREFIGI